MVRVTSVDQLEDAIKAGDLTLSTSNITYLEEPYESLPVTGHE